MKSILLRLVLAFGFLFAMPARPAAAGQSVKILDSTIDQYQDLAKTWEPVIRKAATRLFLILCVVSLVYTAGFGFIRGNFGLGDFFSEFMKFGITMGFFYWLLDNGPRMASSIITSMTLMGQEASSTYIVQLTPSDIVTQGFDLLYRAVAEFGQSDYSTGIVVIVTALMTAVVFGVIAAQMTVLLCSAWVMIYAGVFYLGFGGGRWTSSIAVNYFKTVFALAMQIFTFCLLIGVGQAQIAKLTAGMRTARSIAVANYWSLGGLIDNPVKVVHSETLTLSDMGVVLVFAVVLAILVSRLPGLVAGIITGSSIAAMAFGGVGGAVGSASGLVGSAAGVATGAGMMAAQAAGAGMVLNSAYRQAQQNMADGGGRFAGAALSGGLAGAMSKGLTFASDMMTNMVSGAKDAAAESVQRRTLGGAVSAHIESNAATGAANRQAAAADAGADAPSGSSATEAATPNSSGGSEPAAGVMFDGGGISGVEAYDKSKIGLPDDGQGYRR
ncbi:MAG: P-type conjugative transfer protein TrbL [Planctomycetota bacterium]|jgi:type IV secretion system protein VirB6/type IV secretion system protein TrbL|nr:P-type conjugative transfer protein TrbL [Planctomycetota bacterium]